MQKGSEKMAVTDRKMEITKWVNLERIFIFIRFDIRNKDNYQVVDIIIKAIKNNVNNEEMCKMIFKIMPKWRTQLVVKGMEDKEMIIPGKLEIFLIRAVELIKDTISTQEYEIAYDTADILQGLYGIVIGMQKRWRRYWQKKKWKQYWQQYLKPFQKKWDYDVFYEFKHISG